jgi:hypothetical protein
MAGVKVSIGGDAQAAFAAFDGVAKKAESIADRIRNGFQQRIGQRLFDGLAVASAQIPSLLGKAITAASDMGEVTSKTGEVFQSSAAEMMAWAETSASAFGLSSSAALAAASDMGNLFRSMDMAPDKAAEMSRAMVELAADLASFNNTSIEDATEAIGAALRGEAEPIRRYGVLLNDATLKAEAMAKGLSDGKSTLDPATKALAAYNLILSKTATAQGDFTRTNTGLANSTRILQAQLGNAAVEFGTAFIPTLEKLAASLKQVDMQGAAQNVAAAASVIVNAIMTLAPAVKYVGGLYVGLKITSMIASIYAKAQAWKAETAAIAANTAALRGNAAAGAAAAASKSTVGGGAARGRAGGLGGMLASAGPLLAVTAAAALLEARLASLTKANEAMMTAFERGNAAVEKFNVGVIKGQVTSREEIKKATDAIYEEAQAIRDAAEAQLENTDDGETRAKLIRDTNVTIGILLRKAQALNGITNAQLEANAATKAAADAEQKQAAATAAASAKFKELRDAFRESQAKGDTPDLTGNAAQQLAALEQREKALRASLSQGRDMAPQELMEELEFGADSPQKTKDLETAIQLHELEKQRLKLTRELEESRSAATKIYTQEMNLLDAQLKGDEQRIASLKREAEIKEEIARLTDAGFDLDTARDYAGRLITAREAAEGVAKAREARGNAQDVIADAEAAVTGRTEERGIEKRAREISEQSGLGMEEATKMAENESSLEKLLALRQSAESGGQFQSTLGAVSDTQRIGAGGGAVASGIDIARQQADLQKQMVALLAEMKANMPDKPISDN